MGHSSLHGLDVVEGVYSPDVPRIWQTRLRDPDDVRTEAEDRIEGAKEAKKAKREQGRVDGDQSRLCDVMRRYPDGASVSKLSEDAKVSWGRVKTALEVMVEDGNAVPCEIRTGNNKVKSAGFRLPTEDEIS